MVDVSAVGDLFQLEPVRYSIGVYLGMIAVMFIREKRFRLGSCVSRDRGIHKMVPGLTLALLSGI